MPDLAAIIEEAASKIALYDRVGCVRDGAPAVIVKAEIVARLLAVAKAAVEAERLSTVARNVYGAIPDESRQGEWQREAWRAAGEADEAIERLFAAVRGEGKETTNG